MRRKMGYNSSFDFNILSKSAITKDINSSNTPKISIIVPVYNEESRVSLTLARLKEIFNLNWKAYELIVVNDGSTDSTLDVIQKEEEMDQHIRSISYMPNRGKGYAVKVGVMQSIGEVVMFIDGDFEFYTYSRITDYIKELETYDIVIGSKRHPLSKVNAPISRKILSKMFNTLVRIIIGIRIKDTQSGLKAGRGDLLRRAFKVMRVERYAFDVELLTIAIALNLHVKELPVDLTVGSRVKVREIVKMLIDVLGISYRYRIRRFYQNQLDEK